MAKYYAECSPPLFLFGGHGDTLYAKWRCPPMPDYRREYHADSSALASVAYDCVDGAEGAPLVVLLPGLEGSSRSHYAVALMRALQRCGWHGVVVHYRGCGGMDNPAPMAYHAGDSQEVAFVLAGLAQRYPTIFAVGVSLGGNMLAKYLAEQGEAAVVQAAAIVSAPLDLAAGAQALNRGVARYLYNPYFLRTLLPKARAMAHRFPELGINATLRCQLLSEFDDAFTAPVHGFADAEAYYRQCSAKPLLSRITTPTWLLNARNDPFVPVNSLPRVDEVSAAVHLSQPARGGHVGFVRGGGLGDIACLGEQIIHFFTQQIRGNHD